MDPSTISTPWTAPGCRVSRAHPLSPPAPGGRGLRLDVAVLGAPFDGGVSFRPGRASVPPRSGRRPDTSGPPTTRTSTWRFRVLQAVDAGDVPCNPFDIDEALAQVADHAAELLSDRRRLVTIGGDHTVALGALRAVPGLHGAVAVVHLDAHLDTWDTYSEPPAPMERYSAGRTRKDSCFRTPQPTSAFVAPCTTPPT